MKNRIFIDCSQANRCCDKAQYKDASLTEKLKMVLHLIFCKPCRKYTSNNHKLSRLIEKSDLQSCTKDEKQHWEKLIKSEINE